MFTIKPEVHTASSPMPILCKVCQHLVWNITFPFLCFCVRTMKKEDTISVLFQ